MELEELEEEEEEMSGEQGQANWMMEQTIKFMQGAFKNFKEHIAFARASQPEDQLCPASATNGMTTSTMAVSAEARSTAAVAATAPTLRGMAQHPMGIGISRRRR